MLQFKSVIEEDDEDIDEDDVGDEELAQLVAMATALTESESEEETETEEPEGERGAAVGSDSTSEASTNTPLHVSYSCFPAKDQRPLHGFPPCAVSIMGFTSFPANGRLASYRFFFFFALCPL